MTTEQVVMSVDIVFETDHGNTGRTGVYVTQGLVTAFPGLRNAVLAMAIRDGEGTVVRTMVQGNPSKEMRELMEYQFGPDDPEAQPA